MKRKILAGIIACITCLLSACAGGMTRSCSGTVYEMNMDLRQQEFPNGVDPKAADQPNNTEKVNVN